MNRDRHDLDVLVVLVTKGGGCWSGILFLASGSLREGVVNGVGDRGALPCGGAAVHQGLTSSVCMLFPTQH